MHGNVKYPKLHDCEWLKQKYVEDGLTDGEIAEVVGSTQTNVSRMRRKHRIELSPDRKEKVKELDSPLSDEDVAFLEGELLGDGSLVLPSDSQNVRFAYTSKYEKYIDWLSERLERMGFETRVDHVESDRSQLRTLSYRSLTELHKEWYCSEKRVPDRFSLSPTSLRQWFIGDGTRYERDGARRPTIVIWNTFMTISEKERFREQFENRGISVTFDDERFYVRTKSHERFYDYMKNKPRRTGVYDYKWGV